MHRTETPTGVVEEPVCPDCGKPIATHSTYPHGRCPVVRTPWPSPEVWDWYYGLSLGAGLLEPPSPPPATKENP